MCGVLKPSIDIIRHGTKSAFLVCKVCKSHVNRLQRFGLTPEAFQQLIEKQGGRCAICECDLKFVKNSSVVDHCHKTHVIRGLLCRACNSAIALFKESDRNFERATQYLADARTQGIKPQKIRAVYGYIREWSAQKVQTQTSSS